jgi:hypothetical protein
MDWAELIGGLGIGSLVSSAVSHFMARRASTTDRLYQEKREAYLGLLNALHDAAVRPSAERAKAYALWQTRCSLFGSSEVSRFVQLMIDTNEGPADKRQAAFAGLIETMRADLKR